MNFKPTNNMLHRYKTISLVLIVLVLLTYAQSCKVGPNFEKSTPPTEAVYRYDSIQADTVVNLRWWELFNNPDLDTLIKIGLLENKNVLTAASKVEAARIQVGFTKVDIYPSFGLMGTATVGNVIGNQPLSSDAGLYLGGLTMNWEIDFWGKFRRATEAARANYMASEYAQRAVQVGLITEITNTYFVLLDFKYRLEISEQTVASRQQALQIIEARFREGIVPEIDVNQAKIQLNIAKSAVPRYKRSAAYAENALSILLGRNPEAYTSTISLIEQDYPADIPPGIPSTLLERRPDIIQAESILHAETANVGVAEAMRFPAISLTGLVGGVASQQLSAAATGGFAWSASAGLISPLLNWGKNKKRAEIQKQVALQAAYSYENTVIGAFRDVEDALVNISTQKEELFAREAQVTAALSGKMLSQKRYDGGVTSYLEVLESDRSAFDAELQYSQVRQQLLNSYIQLYKALGGGWLSDQEEQTANNPPPADQ
jgi:multidrug efflux system outer membrane protein